MLSMIPQNPWSVPAGLYVRTDGSLVALEGRDSFWSAHCNQTRSDAAASMLCHAESTAVDETREDAPPAFAPKEGNSEPVSTKLKY
jgi:hypothetical protein